MEHVLSVFFFYLIYRWIKEQSKLSNLDLQAKQRAEAFANRVNFVSAEEALCRLLRTTEQQFGRNGVELCPYLRRLAQLKLARGDDATAERLFWRVHSIQEANLGSDSPDFVSTLEALADLAEKKGDMDTAVTLIQQVLAKQTATHPEDSDEVAISYTKLGCCCAGRATWKVRSRCCAAHCRFVSDKGRRMSRSWQ